MKKQNKIKTILCAALTLAVLGGCGGQGESSKDNYINVVSREDGSGTRGAFIELLGIEEKGADGSKTDRTTKEATFVNKTDVMLGNIAGDLYAIGYASLGSLSSDVKALAVDGTAATSENVKNGSYKLARPFNIAVTDDVQPTALDFINFILSREGQEVVSKSYIAVNDNAPTYAGGHMSGKIVVAGSSSVTPVMEKLKEAYQKVNPDVVIEVQMTDSTAGLNAAAEGTCDIGMSSRSLKENEKKSLTETAIALDGIAIIVNPLNPLTNISAEDAKSVFIGEKKAWSELAK